MKHVLFIGQTPQTVDFSDSALPPGFNAEKIHAGIGTGMKQMEAAPGTPIAFNTRPEDTGDAAARRLG